MTLKFDQPDMKLYVKSMGKVFRVTAVVQTDAEANAICERDDKSAVIAQDCNGLIYLANKFSSVCKSDELIDD